MKFKIITLLAVAIGFTSCDDVDTNRLLGIDDNTKVETKVEETEEIELFSQVWEKKYSIDIDKDYPDYAENIEYVDFKAFLYEITKFEGDGLVKGGDVEVFLADQLPEVERHDSFKNDVANKRVTRIDNQAKINGVKEKFEKERKADFVFRVTLDQQPIVPIKIAFKFDFDMEVSGDLSNLDLDGLEDKNNN